MSAPISANGNGQNGSTAAKNSNGVSSEKENGTNGNDSPHGHHAIKRPNKIGTGLKDRVHQITKGPPGGFDPTPLPDAPQGYTIRFIFHGASNLAPADFVTISSDPFLHATLKGTQPKRHKEDPDLTYRTRTIQKTTEPQWDDEWVVANVPPTGFTLKCRLYDEDFPDHDDRLGNVTIKIPSISQDWQGIPPPGRVYEAKKRVMSKRAYLTKAVTSVVNHNMHMTPLLRVSMELLGPSAPPYAQMHTVGPTTWVKHFSPLIGRLAGVKVNANSDDDAHIDQDEQAVQTGNKKTKTQKYDFQANEMQLQGPVPPKLYHRFVEFRPIIASIYSSAGLRGTILNKALHGQHRRIYNFNASTEYGRFDACTPEAAEQFLKLVHFDEGGRIFTYVLTLDGMFRFTETGKEFGIDMLSKHTMHSDVETYIACSGEFFIRRLNRPIASDEPNPNTKTHPSQDIPGGPPKEQPPHDPSYYQLVIDNDSGTYRPDKSTLPYLKDFLENNFPGMGIVTMHWEDQELQDMKENQRNIKKNEGRLVNMVLNRSQSSISSAESELDDRETSWQQGHKSKREVAYEALEDPHKVKDAVKSMVPGLKHEKGESSK
ncbi:hypothetical protein FGSG_09691 [Fusarium graminearum PH-1]|uniref:Chromosome 4, complete genome n=1 Tax=Gibberella zeae (strain ATCC MYA-4620 / CBS 123657 / FGSC 9075 / NRRL 31084 / PH-1) TaxID=229533 RepID=I1RZ65_GIBZE|nr:hypothetical protein FGSG_09691 [Fusarium graminearum PH-1]ESU16302.1 hypothetical protein FGSG_09691 [Fusarium graminearum PH-1]CAF3535299.1 unnamed protein product [Fusarium graminearum]CEF84368.1 unnamed protein product [Fusarium graminearum]|eukprot:XP_011328014.1 hypothetical protein FGSG_09691 [Fusarium graminearum PH-1]